VVEVMGRDTGWVAVMGGLAGGADLIIIPEFPLGIDDVVAHLDRRRSRGSDFSIIVVSEGVSMDGMAQEGGEPARTDAFGHAQLSKRGVGEWLAAMIEDRTGHETRTTVLGYTQRGGSPTAYDRIWATRVGASAYSLAAGGRWGMMPVVRGGTVEIAAISDVVAEQRRVPAELYDLARVFF
jgi:ATP-dependent phosphofructokinase / diphosphate-dependent phosphofructokinase